MNALAGRIVCVVAVSFMVCAAGTAMAQESGSLAVEKDVVENAGVPSEAPVSDEPASAPVPEPSAPPAASAPSRAVAPQWIWGEVVSVDKAKNQLQIKHLDYETYEEVTKVIQTDSATLFENVAGVGDLKGGESVTVDFKMKDGVQLAELIVVDKNHSAATAGEASAPALEPAPASPAEAPAPETAAQPPALSLEQPPASLQDNSFSD